MKRAVPVRMQEWPEGHFPNSKQLQTYPFFGNVNESHWNQTRELDCTRNRFGLIQRI